LSSGGAVITNSNWGSVTSPGGSGTATGTSMTLTNPSGGSQGYYRVSP
jgi:hypothetical protein